MEREIFFSSSNCSLVLVISRRASWTLPIPLSVFFGPLAPCPAACCFSFCACIMACLFFSASSKRFLFSSASLAFLSASSFLNRSFSSFFCRANFFSCSALISFLLACFSFSLLSSSSSLDRCFLHSLVYSRSCSSSSPFLAGFQEVSISLFRGVGGNFLLLIVFFVRHDDVLFVGFLSLKLCYLISVF